MTQQWILVKVKSEKTDEKGFQKKVSEHYLVDALTFAEAEQRAMTELEAYGDCEVAAVSKMKLDEVRLSGEGDFYFYKAKIAMISIDEKSLKEKKHSIYALVQNVSLASALKEVETLYAPVNGQVEKIEQTQIVDVLLHESTIAEGKAEKR